MTLYIPENATSIRVSFNTPNLNTQHILAIQSQYNKNVYAWILTPIESNDRYSEFEIDIDAAERLEHINAIYNYEVQKDGIVLERGLLKYITEEGGSNGSIEYVSDNETKEATQYYRPQY